MNKEKTRLAAIGLGLCFFVCALSIGMFASMNGVLVSNDGNAPSNYAVPDVLDFRINEPQVYANPDQGSFRINTPCGSSSDSVPPDLSKYEQFGEIPIEVIPKFPRLVP